MQPDGLTACGLGGGESRADAPVALGRALLLGLLAALRQPAFEAAGLPQDELVGEAGGGVTSTGRLWPGLAAEQLRSAAAPRELAGAEWRNWRPAVTFETLARACSHSKSGIDRPMLLTRGIVGAGLVGMVGIAGADSWVADRATSWQT
jgi:hypothetical protein